MKTIRTKFLSLLLALVTILSLLPTAAFAASNTGSGLKITTNQAYWSTRLLANGTPYSYRPPLVDGKLVYCMDSGLGYHYATPSYLNSFTWTSGTGADADAVLQSAVTNSGLSEMDAATVENVKWMMTYLNDCKSSNVGQLFMAVQTYVWENQSYKGEPGGDGDAGGYANADTYELYLSLIDSLLAKKAAEDAEFQRQIEEYADEDGNSVSDMVPKGISELHDEAEEAAEYSVDLSEEPEAVPSESTPISSTEESDWGVQEPKKEIAEEKVLAPALEASVSVEPPKAAPKSDRQLFYELKFNNLDRGLTPEERQEWNSIYASYRGRSAITGTIIGVDPHSIYVWNPETERREKKTMYCAIVVPYRVRIVIPASEMWEAGNERPDYVLQNMVGASIDLVIIKVEREAGFAIGSRRLASRSQRYFFAHREDLHRIGSRVKCRMLAVGPRRCLVDCYGHDLDLTQREMRYAAIPDLRDEYHPGMELESVVKVYDPAKDELVVSIKETETNPTLGAERRHPVGSRRLAVISGKYGGGVFCNLPDGVVCMCNYSFQHEDSDFMVGENVMLVVQRYNEEKLQMFGKILSKW